jgi:hypothetical protein
MVKKVKKMLSRTVHQVRERMGLTLIDMQWITGTMQRKGKVDDDQEISDPSFAILLRYLEKYPEENPLPVIPEIFEIESMLSINWDRQENSKFCTRRLGPLFGCSPLAGYKWSKDSTPSQTVRHIMLIVSNAIKKEGKAGLDRYLDIVKEEAAARDIDMGVLWLKGWQTYSKREEAEREKAHD